MAQVQGLDPHFGEDVPKNLLDFSESSIRRGFIRKVYALVMCQLLVTMGFISIFVFYKPTQLFVETHTYIIWTSFVVVFVTIIAMACCESARRKAPNNFIFLFIFTVAMSIPLGFVSSKFQVKEVFIALGVTATICLALTIFAFQTKWDFTLCGGWLIAALTVLVTFGFMMLFLPYNNKLNLLYSGVGVLLFSMYLVYDTQIMMGGEHRYSISPEEYVFAALNIYLDIINIFIRILRLIRY
ncbi:protein lifeguard 2-like [Pieris napi]|uniref:protein lifeguard 2-like n=1 Tax=Pieris napi TaxID=78633 RepID=UPI001FB95A6C|nr:protein lifeguard 2-like [Pieris napi]